MSLHLWGDDEPRDRVTFPQFLRGVLAYVAAIGGLVLLVRWL